MAKETTITVDLDADAIQKRDNLVIACALRAASEVKIEIHEAGERKYFAVNHPHGVTVFDTEQKAEEFHYKQTVDRTKELIGDGKLHGWFQTSPSGEPIEY